ncbi:MAG: ABC transporter ATP-binding protein [Oscillatoriales cyanobacterium RM2_1_1]|nr:ABC transporter ATP-binding protein [Oscillatoriales cyanobacterium SM2_3_0]NJO46829.1 ABC transporter ATP-binding protein [Oscillatoriales cyanobacterium RM2_1_1]
MADKTSAIAVGVQVSDLVFSYPHQGIILQNISFTLNLGERVALLGRTGSGKSTLMENLVGLKRPNSGEIQILGTTLGPETLFQVRQQIGFAFQDPNNQLFMPTILEDVIFGPCNYGVPEALAREQADQLLAGFSLSEVAHRSVHELSGGQKRLAALATVLALNPDILILDEPTNGLDPWWRRHLAEILIQLPVQILLIASHDLHWVSRVTQRALVLKQGQIQVDQPTIALLQDRPTLESCGLPPDY